MAYPACENCGSRLYGGYCVNCHEEVFIAQQYEADGESVPDLLLEKIAEFEPQEKRDYPIY
jgi:hypothetical protein